MELAIKYTHLTSVILFMLIYLVKTILLLANSTEKLKSMTKMVKLPEMIVSFLFLGTGVYMLAKLPMVNMFMLIKILCVLAAIPLAVIGFKKGNKALAVLSLLLIIGSYGLAEVSHKKMVTGGSDANVTSTDGRTIYMNYCSKCHGEDGKLGAMGAADISLSKLDKAGMMTLIKEGKNQMSGFGETLSDEQVNAVIDYVNSLKK